MKRSSNDVLTRRRISLEAHLGSIALVGAGPGNPDLLTVQATNLLGNADLVISDRLVSKELLSLVKCEILVAGKRPG